MKKNNKPYTCPADVLPITTDEYFNNSGMCNKSDNSVFIKVINKSSNDLPTKATEGSAAMDVRAWCVNDNFIADGAEWDEESKCIRIFSGGRALIHTGLYFEIPQNYVLQVCSRSGLAIKSGISVLNSPGLIDADK